MAVESDNTNTAVIESPGARTSASGANAINTDAESEAQQDEVLARILGGGADEKSQATDGGARDQRGRFASKSNEKSEKKPEAKSEAAPKSADATAPEGVNAADYRKALTALQFDKVSQKALDALDPAEIVAWGLERAKNHADVDRLKSQLGELKKTKEAPAKPADSQEQPLDLSKAVEPVVKQFAALLGDETTNLSEPLTAFGKQLVESATASLQAQLAAQQQVIDSIQSEFTTQQRDAARSTLTEKYELDKHDRWQQVLERREADKNEYASEQEAIEAACKYEFAEEIIAGYEAKLKEQHKLRDKGQSSTTHTKTPAKAQTQEDQEDLVLGAILDGDRDKAARIGRGSYRGAREEEMYQNA